MFHVNCADFIRICKRLLRDPHSWVYVDVQWQQDGTAVILIDNVAWFAHKPITNNQIMGCIYGMGLLEEGLLANMDLD